MIIHIPPTFQKLFTIKIKANKDGDYLLFTCLHFCFFKVINSNSTCPRYNILAIYLKTNFVTSFKIVVSIYVNLKTTSTKQNKFLVYILQLLRFWKLSVGNNERYSRYCLDITNMYKSILLLIPRDIPVGKLQRFTRTKFSIPLF